MSKKTPSKPVEVAPAAPAKKVTETIGPDELVFYKGKWVKAGQIIVSKKAPARSKARTELVGAIITQLKETGTIDRPVLKQLGITIGQKHGFKKALGFKFLLKQGVLKRLEGTRLYGLRKKAQELYPELFGEVPEAEAEEEAAETEPQPEEEEITEL